LGNFCEALQLGVLVVMRNIYPVRLILMMFPFIPRAMKLALIGMRGILDMISAKRFDVSLNPMPFPMFTRGGTEIPHGLKLDIIDFNFFHIILVRRVFLHVTFLPPGIECHIFIDPFDFKIGETTILSLTGLEGDNKKAAKAKKAEALKQRAAAEAIAKAKFDAGLTLANLRAAKVRWLVQVVQICVERA